MASEQELGMAAVGHAKKTSWSWDRYLQEIRQNPNYAYQNTEWYQAGLCLQMAKSAPPTTSLADAQKRMYLANDPLECLQAPAYMIPVATADLGYRHYYTPDVIEELRFRFGTVEAWCDCRTEGTPYPVAEQMVQDLGLDGPAWGQCETQPEFDHAYGSGARRMVGNLSALDDASLAKVSSGEVHVSAELYRNVQPWMVPDWRGANAGVGGNCVACYESETEGAVYTSIADYKSLGYYVSGRDSVYGVGLQGSDWASL